MERWRYDPRSRILFSPENGPDNFTNDIHRSQYQHEVCHWIHLQSSSTGLLITLLERAMALTARNAIARLPVHKRGVIIEDAQGGAPIWSFARGFDPTVAGEDFGLSGQFWLDLAYFRDLLMYPERIEGVPWHGMETIQCALADAWLAGHSLDGLDDRPDNTKAEAWLSGDWEMVQHRGDLSMRMLLECQCVLDELRRTPASSGDPDRTTSDLLARKKLEKSRYGYPARLLGQAWQNGDPPLDVVRIALHFALDPPMPFLNGSETPSTWMEIDPSMRWLGLCHAMSRSESNRKAAAQAVSDPQALLDLFTLLTGLRCADWPIVNSHLLPVGHRKIPSPPTKDAAYSPSIHQPFAGDVNAVAVASLQLRSAFFHMPESFLLPNDTHVEVIPSRSFQANLREAYYRQSLLKPFMQAHADGDYTTFGPEGSVFVPTEDLPEYVLRCAQRNVLERLIRGSEWSRMEYLPQFAQEEKMLGLVLASLKEDDRQLIW